MIMQIVKYTGIAIGLVVLWNILTVLFIKALVISAGLVGLTIPATLESFIMIGVIVFAGMIFIWIFTGLAEE